MTLMGTEVRICGLEHLHTEGDPSLLLINKRMPNWFTFYSLIFCPVVIGYFIFNPTTTDLMYGWTNENHVFFIWTGGLSISILFILSFVCLESSPYLNRFFPWSIPIGAVLFYAILGFGCGWTYSILLFLFIFLFNLVC